MKTKQFYTAPSSEPTSLVEEATILSAISLDPLFDDQGTIEWDD